jgi:predicted phosphatase
MVVMSQSRSISHLSPRKKRKSHNETFETSKQALDLVNEVVEELQNGVSEDAIFSSSSANNTFDITSNYHDYKAFKNTQEKAEHYLKKYEEANEERFLIVKYLLKRLEETKNSKFRPLWTETE